jgi:lysine 2,3-aminomutase
VAETLDPLRSITTLTGLIEAGLSPAAARAALDAVAERYAIGITPEMAKLIDPDDRADPIARQFVPDSRELETRPEERADPIADDAFSPVPGIVHRYPDRVLLKPLHACPVYCRFCFRRETVGPGGDALSDEALDAALAHIRARPEIFEVIVTGGDPLMLSARRIEALTKALSAIPHVAVVRWHTRVPVVSPKRVTAQLVAALRARGAATFLAIHANHPREFTPAAAAALARLADAGIPLVGQSVLLRGVNDDVATLDALMRAFLRHRVKPYYLHHPDLAPGTGHFRLSIEEGRRLMRALRGRLSGLGIPAYVLDVPDGAGKVPLGPDHVHRTPDGLTIETIGGDDVRYPPLPD